MRQLPNDRFLRCHRRLPEVVAVGFCAFLLVSVANSANAVGEYVLNEKFNSMTSGVAPTAGWTSVATSASVEIREHPFRTDKSVRIEKTAATGESSLSRTFADKPAELRLRQR